MAAACLSSARRTGCCGLKPQWRNMGSRLDMDWASSGVLDNITLDKAAISILTPLPATTKTYKVWLLVAPVSDNKQATFRTTVDNANLDVTIPANSHGATYLWLYAGDVNYMNTQEIRIWMPPYVGVNNAASYFWINYLRGIYLTEGSETPTCQPSGAGGDLTSC